jgi:nucleoid-associated protein YgaU
LKVGEGGWIIINDRIFTAPNKKNKTLQLHPPSDLKGAAGPMEGKKRATPCSKTGKKSDVKHQHKIRILQFSFCVFLLQINRNLRHRINALNPS